MDIEQTPEGHQLAHASTNGRREELTVLMDLLSHDILNKNQATLSYLELIHSQPGDEKRTKDFAERAASQLRASSMLLDGIRRFVTSTRRQSIPTEPVDLVHALSSVIRDVSDMFPYRRVTVDSSGLAPGTVVRGAQFIDDLFRNLLVNIVQLDPQDDVTIVVRARQEERGGSSYWTIDVTAPTAVIPQGVDDSLFSQETSVDVSKMARVSGAVFASSITRSLGGRFRSRVLEPDSNVGCGFEISLEEAGPA